MYEPSVGFYNSVIQAQVRRLAWHGTLTDADGVAHSFTADNIAADSGRLTRACASATEIALGTVYASQLALGLYVDDIGVDRAKIYGGTITLACTVSAGLISGEVPLGVFTITEALQNGEVCSISAYDAMINFDKPYLGVSGLATPYNWAQNFCTRCGVTLGMDEADFSAFPNGGTDLTLIWNDDIETYRDALSHLAAAIGSVATINRDGELVFLPMESSASVATVKTNDRFDSDIAHTVFTPLTIYLTNAETGEMKSATAGSGNAYLDLGANALLQADGKLRNAAGQVTDIRTVQTMLNDIIGHAQSFSSVPISAEIPCDPCLDLFDCVTLTGGQAAAGGTVVKITEIETKFGGSTTIGCAGANTADHGGAESRQQVGRLERAPDVAEHRHERRQPRHRSDPHNMGRPFRRDLGRPGGAHMGLLHFRRARPSHHRDDNHTAKGLGARSAELHSQLHARGSGGYHIQGHHRRRDLLGTHRRPGGRQGRQDYHDTR